MRHPEGYMTKTLPAIVGVALLCAGCLPERALLPGGAIPARTLDGETRRLTDAEKTIIRRSVLTDVRNTSFAEFRWTRFSKSPTPTEYYCAQVNAQTEPGRWVGFRPFVVSVETSKDEIRSARLVELAGDRLDIAGVVSKCRENGLDVFATVESDGAGVVNVSPR